MWIYTLDMYDSCVKPESTYKPIFRDLMKKNIITIEKLSVGYLFY